MIITHSTLELESTIEFLRMVRGKYMVINGLRIKLKEDRIMTFRRFGVDCLRCGAKGAYFAIERHPKEKYWQFNLYCLVPGKGTHFRLMTSDHIWPKDKGGNRGSIKNRQPLCTICNRKKGSNYPSDREVEILRSRGVDVNNFSNSLSKKSTPAELDLIV